MMKKFLGDVIELDKQIEKQKEEVLIITELVKNLIHENASTKLNQDDYVQKYDSLNKRYENATEVLDSLQAEKQRKVEQDNAFTLYIKKMLKNPEVLHEWSDTIWMTMVEKAIIHKNKNITFYFYNGTTIEVED